MPRKIVIVGSGGRLGAALLREWRERGEEVVGFNRELLDLGDFSAIRERLDALEFDVLVNCAAQTNVDRCECEPEEAFRVNSGGVAALADVCTRKKARCIHISTDYVFDGTKEKPYTEDDEPRPISKYGESKLSGERCLQAVSDRHLIVRVSWVFGPDRASFVDQIIQRALTQDRVEAIADKISVPTYTLDAARLLWPLVEQPEVGGVMHLCNAGECSWQQYGQHALNCAAALGMPLCTQHVEPLKLAEMKNFVAARPRYTPLATKKFTGITGITPRPWTEAVEEYVRTIPVGGASA
ncbi:dTDP-4-dehydrorhamnose reductase [Chthoniobacter flavus Ellin428]|uniref:dTDP-4-dehydrorhamnose reductase n=1 Tax=Chthoniobacter flavus Ellin428 TaxID=497964 RepID=B4D6B4_9BACT|nr:dTDP-4-dehydrorhamnose reductase [Chthoniobacter flavus]EDY18023.1 dTDP-4-dehydrorhamnose reductase [Chthoniobacter flavus Ellin428]TCO88265.1 dTDP-4-dehydrorhamnose reductase [Chthoniobacter flavus]